MPAAWTISFRRPGTPRQSWKKQIEAVQADKSKAIEEKALLDQRNEMLRTEVNLIQRQADETEGSHYRADREGEGTVRAVLQAGATGGGAGHGFLLVGDFKATDFTDLLARMDFVNEVMDYDRQVIADLQETRQQLSEDKAALDQQRTELSSSQKKLQQQIDGPTH